jgi:hypothetical protein
MFRKSVLDMVRFGDKNQPIMRAADGHFNRICHALAGSGLIDLPLSGYRIHGHNYFARNENIDGLSRGGIQKAEQIEEEFVATSEVLLENAIKLSSLLGRKYWGTIDQCLGASGGISLRRYRSRSVHQIFMRHAEVLRAAHGERKFCREIGKRFSYSRARAILKKGLGREPSAKSTAMLLLHSGERHVLAVSRALKLGEPRR